HDLYTLSLHDALPISWDRLDGMCGPFDRAVLWLDVEGSELRALRGAARLLARGAVDLVNVEVIDRGGDRAALEAVSELLRGAGLDRKSTRLNSSHQII